MESHRTNLENLQHQLVLAEQRFELADADEKDATAELIKLSKLRSKSRNSVSDAEYRKYSQIQINATQAKNNALEQVRNIRRMIAAAPVSRFQQLVRSRGSPTSIPKTYSERMALVRGNKAGSDLVSELESAEIDLEEDRREGESLSSLKARVENLKDKLKKHLSTRKRS